MDIGILQSAADRLGCDLAAVQAIVAVESSGVTHWPSGDVPILFEAQHFSRLTGHRYDVSHPAISSPKWNRALYKGGQAEYGRLAEARTLDEAAALQSCSWGAFQIMGFHWQALRYASVQEMVEAMKHDAGQVEAFVRFIEINPALKASLSIHAWRDFARGYTGPGQVDAYAAKLETAFGRHGGVA